MNFAQPYQELNGKICIVAPMLFDANLLTQPLLDKFIRKNPNATRQRGGNGRSALLELNAIPEPYLSRIIEKFGDPRKAENPLKNYFSVDPKAKTFFESYTFENGNSLHPEQVTRFTFNASTLNALIQLKISRETMRSRLGNGSGDVWTSLINDVHAFNQYLKLHYQTTHTLPNSPRLKERFKKYQEQGYASLVDQRAQNTNAQKVTSEMVCLWNDLFGTLGHKPDKSEVFFLYEAFLTGTKEVVSSETGEVYDFTAKHFLPVSESCIGNYLSKWVNKAPLHKVRSGDRQKYMGKYKPYHKLEQPKFAGSMISVDDRQPPFEYAPSKRLWFYNAIDLGSEAFTAWVYGETKEGIILNFYRQVLRNYTEWGMPLPYELEGEMSLNSSYTGTILFPGNLFQKVRIEANNARGKRIEGYYRNLRYGLEKKREGWLARPFALNEANQPSAAPDKLFTKAEIVQNSLADIQAWNNTLHSNQELYKGLTRWQVQKEHQHPEVKNLPTNWRGILPHLGYCTDTSMRLGRITLQGMHRVVGINGEVALGDDLINLMAKIEGKQVKVYWLDDSKGNVMKAHVHDAKDGRYICDLLGDLAYQRSTLERTDADMINRELMSAYVNTVDSFIKRAAGNLNRVEVMDKDQPAPLRADDFRIPGLQQYTVEEVTESEILPEPAHDDEFNGDLNTIENHFKPDTKSRF